MVAIYQKKSNLILKINAKVLIAYFCFLFFNILYFLYFTNNWECYAENGCSEFFYYALNGDSLKAYNPILSSLINNGWLSGNSETGSNSVSFSHAISYIYYFLWLIFRFETENVFFVAFILNNILLIISYVFFVKVGRDVIRMDMSFRWLYFLNPMLIYITQMINKEAFLLATTFMFAYYCLVKRRRIRNFIPFFSAILITALVRYPFILLVTVRFLIKRNQVSITRLISMAVILLLINGYRLSLISYESSLELARSDGITMKAFEYNKYYLGSLLLAPLKIIGFFYDLIQNLFVPYIWDQGKFNLNHISTIPIIIAFLLQYRSIIYIIKNPILALRGPFGPLLAFVIIFLIIISGNMYIHDRYLWPIMPLLVLILFGIRKKILRYRG
jgi:hypothetical protein